MSGHQKRATGQGALTSWKPQRERLVGTWKERDRVRDRRILTNWRPQRQGLVRTQKKVTGRGVLTNWGPKREGLVRIQKASKQVRGTHDLETTGGGISQDTERKQASDRHSLSVDHRERHLSGDGKKVTE